MLWLICAMLLVLGVYCGSLLPAPVARPGSIAFAISHFSSKMKE
jgi:hypothetical protein